MTKEELEQIQELLVGELGKIKGELEEEYTKQTADRDKDYITRLEKLEADYKDTLKALALNGNAPALGAVDGNTGDPNCGYAHEGEYLGDIKAAVVDGVVSKRLQTIREIEAEMKAAGTGFVADASEYGGYLLPEGFRAAIWERTLEISDIMGKVFVLPLGTMSLRIPAMGGYDRSGGLLWGGIQFYDEGETDTLTDVRPKFEQINMNLGLQGALTHVSDAMMRYSGITMGAFIRERFSEGMAWRMEYLLINGTGAGQPKGAINADCKIAVAKETGQEATTLEYENIIKMRARIWRDRNAEWYFNRSCLPQLESLNFIVGAGGERINLESALGGLPYFYNEHCQALGTAGDAFHIDWKQYILAVPVGAVDGPYFDTSIHFHFDTAQSSFRAIWYTDGKFAWRSAETPRHGDTQSPCVTLAAR